MDPTHRQVPGGAVARCIGYFVDYAMAAAMKDDAKKPEGPF